ncbi:MAG: glycosyltransferase family 39 protein [Tepidisphaeraceae bacterium]|jgi:hypothetical protein
MTRRFRLIALPLLAIVGIQGWLLALNGFWGPNAHLTLLAVALVASLIPPLRRIVWKSLHRLRRPTPWQRAITGLVVTLLAGAALAHYAVTCGRVLFPTVPDEFQFLLQTRMLASGRLWMPAHPLLDFFDTFYVLIQPKYAAQSFPGAAILFTPSLWLGIAPWKWALALSAITIGLFYRVVAELIDGLAGLLAATLLTELSLYRYLSTMILAQVPLMLLGLASVWAYLHWRRTRSANWALALGFLGALAFITRPADCLLFGLPIARAMLLDLRSQRQRQATPKSLLFLALGATPCVAIQLTFNLGVTGHLLMTPVALYNQRDQPGLGYELEVPDQNPRPLTHIPEKRRLYTEDIANALSQHRPSLFWHTFITDRLPETMTGILPQPLLAVLLPIGLLSWRYKRAWLLASGLPLFFLVFTPYPLFKSHYPIVAAPAAIVGVLLGFKAITHTIPRARAGVWTAAVIFIGGLMVTPTIDHISMVSALTFHASPGNRILDAADAIESDLTTKNERALILFRRDRTLSVACEPVYNLATPWPDDATVIRAHDRGPGNWQIFQYYARLQPDRRVYLFNERIAQQAANGIGDALSYLGTAGELAGPTPAPPTTSAGH